MFGDFAANDDVSLSIAAGEVHALVGENGAGKTTLMNIAFGILQPTAGQILIGGHPVVVGSPTVARQHGLGMVHQHFKLVPSLTVAENVMLGAEVSTRWMNLDRRRVVSKLREVSERHGLAVDPTQPVARLSAGVRQRVEILKALYFDATTLILDEPTAVLTPQEADQLFGVLRDLVDRGRSVVFITHKLPEVKAVSDRFTVMRHGRRIATDLTETHSEHDIASLMVGREVSLDRSSGPPPETSQAPVVLECADLVVRDDDGREVVNNVSLKVRAGEIVGVAGVEGNGQTEFVEALAGLRPVESGVVRVAEVDITDASPAERRERGVAHVPEDRLASGVSALSSVQDNLAGGYLRSNLFNRGIVRSRLANRWSSELIEHYDVRGAVPSSPAGRLSGGNMQKVVLARELELNPDLLLAAHPTRGLDIGATEFVHGQLRERRARGTGILLVSADLSELLALSDRLIVMYGGKVVAEFPPDESLVSRIGLAMAGTPDQADTERSSAASAGATGNGHTGSSDTESPHRSAPLAMGRRSAGERAARRDHVELRSSDDAAGHHLSMGSWSTSKLAQVGSGLSQPLSALVVALLVGMGIIVALGHDPIASYANFLLGSFSSTNNFSALVAQATPLLLVAVSVYVSFRAGVINLGAEGQMYLGAFVGAVVALQLSSLPGMLLVLVSFVAGAVAGAMWALIPAVLDAYLGVDILVTTLMFNYIGMQFTAYFVDGPLRDPAAGVAATRQIPAKTALPPILGFGGANVGIFIGLGFLILMGLVLLRTRWGMKARFVGDNRQFARYLGVNVPRMVVQIVLLSGVIAGVAGVVESLGTQLRFSQTFSPGYGFIGLTVALLGRLNPVGVLVAALLYGLLEAGSTLMQLNTGVPLSLVNVLEGVIIILTTATLLRIHRRGRLPGSSSRVGDLPGLSTATDTGRSA